MSPVGIGFAVKGFFMDITQIFSDLRDRMCWSDFHTTQYYMLWLLIIGSEIFIENANKDTNTKYEECKIQILHNQFLVGLGLSYLVLTVTENTNTYTNSQNILLKFSVGLGQILIWSASGVLNGHARLPGAFHSIQS